LTDPQRDPHGDLGSMEPAKQAPIPGVEPTFEPAAERAAGVPSEEEQRGPLWDEPVEPGDERSGALWESSTIGGEGGATPLASADLEPEAPPPAEPAGPVPPLNPSDTASPLEAAPEPIEPDLRPEAALEPAERVEALPAPEPVEELPPPPSAAPPPATEPPPMPPPFQAGWEPAPAAAGAAAIGGDIPRYTPEVVSTKDPGTAFLVELILGIFGFLGIGYLYAGRTNDGIIRLVAFLAYNIIAWTAIILLTFVVVGLCLIPVQIAIQIGVPIWSAITLRRGMEEGTLTPQR
jgi:hypothetical protein